MASGTNNTSADTFDSSADGKSPAINIQGLTVEFASVNGSKMRAVDHVDLRIERGEFVTLVGPSGCGKTTILNLLTGLLSPSIAGSIELLGASPKPGNRMISYMLARDCLLPWRTSLQNACYGMEIRGIELKKREAIARDILKEVGLGEFLDAYPKALSHGMRQRCALARTFALESEVLLMDEPFGALDAQTKLQLGEVLLRLWSEHRKTVVFVTHDLAEAIALSDRVIVMSPRPGRIVADIAVPLERPRNIRELQKNANFHRIYAETWGLMDRERGGDVTH
jgi:NitT/TauT family transport system ATP-binding protein